MTYGELCRGLAADMNNSRESIETFLKEDSGSIAEQWLISIIAGGLSIMATAMIADLALVKTQLDTTTKIIDYLLAAEAMGDMCAPQEKDNFDVDDFLKNLDNDR